MHKRKACVVRHLGKTLKSRFHRRLVKTARLVSCYLEQLWAKHNNPFPHGQGQLHWVSGEAIKTLSTDDNVITTYNTKTATTTTTTNNRTTGLWQLIWMHRAFWTAPRFRWRWRPPYRNRNGARQSITLTLLSLPPLKWRWRLKKKVKMRLLGPYGKRTGSENRKRCETFGHVFFRKKIRFVPLRRGHGGRKRGPKMRFLGFWGSEPPWNKTTWGIAL